MVNTDAEQLGLDPLEAGQEALARGEWKEARAAFEQALARKCGPEALEGLALAAAWLDDAPVMFNARERAYRLYLKGDDRRSAARVAVALALDHFRFRGELAISDGWLQRARRLLEGLESGPEAGWLVICQAHIAVYNYDAVTAQRLCTQAVSLGKSLGNINIEMLARAYEGLALVIQGKISRGMRRLDEATTAIVAGEMTNIDATCTACCCLIYACEQVRDYERAAQWCERLETLAKRWSYHTMFSVCRTYYAGLLIGQGDWDKAEAELATAVHAIESARPAQAAEGLVRLAVLRCRQGRFEEAAALFERAESPPFRALAGHLYLLGRAAMALERNDPQSAVGLAERFLRTIPAEAHLVRAAGLELLIQAWVGLGDRARAAAILAEFRSVVNTITTKPMRGAVYFAEGLVAVTAKDYETAKRCFEDAIELWTQSGAPVETAQARLELAGVLATLECDDAAEQEGSAALETLQKVGAAPEAARAVTLLHQLRKTQRRRSNQSNNYPRLTDRQVEILRLMAQGLSNKEMAVQLMLSPHTVHRHVANILTTLNLSSRAAAVAYAAQHNLL